MTENLIQIHIGKNLPDYIYDSIYQSLLVNSDFNLYVLIDSDLVETFNKKIKLFNIDTTFVKVVQLFECEKVNKYNNYIKKFNLQSFRDSFWISTTSRFFYIEEFMIKYNIESLFHSENDVMLYRDLHKVKDTINPNEMYMVQDSETRVVPSIVYIPNKFISFKNMSLLYTVSNI